MMAMETMAARMHIKIIILTILAALNLIFMAPSSA
jgi:hypothetical protein